MPNNEYIDIANRGQSAFCSFIVSNRYDLMAAASKQFGQTLVGIRVDDHKFRSTAITRWLRDGISPTAIMHWVGHKKLDTILRYAATINVHKVVPKSANALKQFANVGD